MECLQTVSNGSFLGTVELVQAPRAADFRIQRAAERLGGPSLGMSSLKVQGLWVQTIITIDVLFASHLSLHAIGHSEYTHISQMARTRPPKVTVGTTVARTSVPHHLRTTSGAALVSSALQPFSYFARDHMKENSLKQLLIEQSCPWSFLFSVSPPLCQPLSCWTYPSAPWSIPYKFSLRLAVYS